MQIVNTNMNPKMHQSCKFPGPETSMDGYEEALEQYYQENMHKAMPKKKTIATYH